MANLRRDLLLLAGVLFASLPVTWILIRGVPADEVVWFLTALNAAAWVLVTTLLILRSNLKSRLKIAARTLSTTRPKATLEATLDSVLRELTRRHQALGLLHGRRRVSTKEELGATLREIVSLTYKLFEAESAELALFDTAQGVYHSSFVLGRPFHVSAQAMLSGAVEGGESQAVAEIMIEPIVWASETLGSLRVALKRGVFPKPADRELLSLLAMQGGLAIMSADYSTQLLRMKRSADESIRAKTGFLANLSHELRGPLGIMLNASELVLDGLCGPVTPEQVETIGLVKGNGAHLLELINDVLDYAKVESGTITATPVVLRAQELLPDVSSVIKKQAETKGHRLICKPSDPEIYFSCDRRHFRQMLINLLSNAVKYTPQGGTIEVWSERGAAGKVKIFVKDSGIGIAAEDRQKVFAAFERIDQEYANTQVGTGLGMPLTKRLAELNGGSIDFISQVGVGTTFWISLPSAISEQVSTTETPAAVSRAKRGNGETILLVESDAGERQMMERYLAHIGYRVVLAAGREESLSMLRKENISLAIMNDSVVDRPEESVIQSIRNEALASSLPLLLISSRAFAFDVERHLKAGIDRCLIKPVELNELGKICNELIGH